MILVSSIRTTTSIQHVCKELKSTMLLYVNSGMTTTIPSTHLKSFGVLCIYAWDPSAPPPPVVPSNSVARLWPWALWRWHFKWAHNRDKKLYLPYFFYEWVNKINTYTHKECIFFYNLFQHLKHYTLRSFTIFSTWPLQFEAITTPTFFSRNGRSIR